MQSAPVANATSLFGGISNVSNGPNSDSQTQDYERLDWGSFRDTQTTAHEPTILAQTSRSPSLQFNLLGDGNRVVNLDAEIAHGALQLAVPEQQLNRTQIAGLAVD